MKIIDFLKKSLAKEISTEAQMDFLQKNLKITPQELVSVVRFFQKQLASRPCLKDAIDVCGTGGSGVLRINTSTISAIILSSRFGIGVVKHGNKAASGRFGSFDLLESLNIYFTENVFEIEEIYKRENLALLFAPFFHPLLRFFADIRKKLGKPTFFNLLGPLLNPAFPQKQIIGTAFKDKMDLIIETCRLLGKEKVYVVCGEDFLDEVTLTGRTFVKELSGGKIKSYVLTPADFGISGVFFDEIKGGDSKFNTQIAKDILAGICSSRHRDLVLVNVALALKLTDKVKTLKEGYEMALANLTTPTFLQKIVEQKKMELARKKRKSSIGPVEPSTRDFMAAIQKKGLSVIAEIKRASPSEGMICNERFSPLKLAKQYEKSGANAISVLCDKKFFRGDLKHLKIVAENTLTTPILCKDFIIDEYQIYEARKAGADAILLIAAILDESQLCRFLQIADSLKMAVICEVHTFSELKKVLKTPVKIIGINNRDLNTFKVDISLTSDLVKHIPKDKLIVSASGFFSKEDMNKVRGKVDAILVGTALMKGIPLREFIQKKLKICGIRTSAEAKFCEKLGIDFIGLNFVPTSKRFIAPAEAKIISLEIKDINTVGIFQNQSLATVNRIAKEVDLDYIQLSSKESVSFIKKCCRPVIKTISIQRKEDLNKAKKYFPYVAYVLLDAPSPGSGRQIKVNLKNINYPFLLAGGISAKNAKNVLKTINPIGLDIATGIETNGKIDFGKIRLLFNQLKSC